MTALELVENVVERARRQGADAAQADHRSSERFEINFETGAISLLRTNHDADTRILVLKNSRKGEATFTGRTPEAIAKALDTGLAAASSGVEDEANRVAVAQTPSSESHGESAADREAMMETVLGHIDLMRTQYPQVRTRSSAYSFTISHRVFANSEGVTHTESRSNYRVSMMFVGRAPEQVTSFNFSGAASYRPFSSFLEAGNIGRLLDETLMSFDAKPVPEKFVGDVIITPSCMTQLMAHVGSALSGYALLAGTSPYQSGQGERVAARGFSLFNRPRSTEFPGGADFDASGVLTRSCDLISDGVLNEFLVDFYTANKLGRPQTGGKTNLVVPAGDQDIESIIADTAHGIVLSRFSGGQPNSHLDFSGVAKNSFYVRDGEIRHPLKETLVAGNLKDLLASLNAVSRERVNFGNCEYPYMRASGVTISSK